MGLGFWSGANKYMNNKIEREERREEFLMEQLTRTKAMVLPEIMKRMDEKRERVKTRQARVSSATDYGFSPITALTLEKTGQLEFELAKLDKLGPSKIDAGYIENLDAYIRTHLDPNDPNFNNRLAKAVSSGLSVDFTSEEGQLSGLMRAAQATTQGDLNSAIAGMSIGGDGTVPYAGANIEYNTLKAEKVSDARRAAINNSIATSIKPFVGKGSIYSSDNGGQVNILHFDDAESQQILDSVVETVIQSYIEPEIFTSDQIVIDEAVDLVRDYSDVLNSQKLQPNAQHFDQFTDMLDSRLEDTGGDIDIWGEYFKNPVVNQLPTTIPLPTPDVTTPSQLLPEEIDPLAVQPQGIPQYDDQN